MRMLLLLTLLGGVAAAPAQSGRILAEAVIFDAKADPMARKDSFTLLDASQRAYWTAKHGRSTLRQKMDELEQPIESSVSVDVILVGFSGDGNFGLNLEEEDFTPYLEALKDHVQAHVLNAAGTGGTALPVKTHFYYRLTPGSHALAGAVQSGIHKAVIAAGAASCPAGVGSCAADSGAVRIAHSTVDQLIADEHGRSDGAYAVYLLNPQAASRPYLYTLLHDDDDDDEPASDGAHAGCATPLWVGRQRYVWVDLTAAPTTWGPHASGPGVVLPSTLPRPVLPRYHAAARHGNLVADLVTLVRSACEHLLAPPAAHSRLRIYDALYLQIIHVTDVELSDTEAAAADTALGVQRVVDELTTVLVGEQTLKWAINRTTFGHCQFCMAAYARALSTHTSSHMHQQPTPPKHIPKPHEEAGEETHAGAGAPPHATKDETPAVAQQPHHKHDAAPAATRAAASHKLITRQRQFVDSAELASALRSTAVHGLWEELQIRPPPPHAERRWDRAHGHFYEVLPVYIFDVAAKDAVLLDRNQQVVAFDDMVVVMRTRTPTDEQLQDLQCGEQVVRMRPSQVQRPLLAGLLHSLWGVSSPTIAWGDADQAPVYSHLWAVGRNPFGLLGAGHRMSFVQRDAAQRNLVHTYLAATTSAARGLLAELDAFGLDDAPLEPAAADLFTARWAVLTHKLSRAAKTASLHNFNASYYLALSAAHDVGAMRELLQAAAAAIHSQVKCFTEPAFPWSLVAGLVVAAAATAAACVRSANRKTKRW